MQNPSPSQNLPATLRAWPAPQKRAPGRKHVAAGVLAAAWAIVAGCGGGQPGGRQPRAASTSTAPTSPPKNATPTDATPTDATPTNTKQPADPALAPTSVDRVLVVNVWHHLDDRAAYLARLVSALKPGGRVCLVEIKPEAPFGPPARYRLTPQALKAELAASPALVVGEAVLDLEHQYVVVATLKP